MFISQNVKGVIIDPVVDNTFGIECLFELKLVNCPFVLLDEVQGIQANVNKVDHMNAKKIVEYLPDTGHTKIVHFTGLLSFRITQERIEGFKQAFSESSVVLKDNMIVDVGPDYLA